VAIGAGILMFIGDLLPVLQHCIALFCTQFFLCHHAISWVGAPQVVKSGVIVAD
jgi:hypothetical protein